MAVRNGNCIVDRRGASVGPPGGDRISLPSRSRPRATAGGRRVDPRPRVHFRGVADAPPAPRDAIAVTGAGVVPSPKAGGETPGYWRRPAGR